MTTKSRIMGWLWKGFLIVGMALAWSLPVLAVSELEWESDTHKKNFDLLEELEPKRAVLRYYGLKATYAWGAGREKEKAILVSKLLNNPEVREFLETRIEELPHSYFNSGERNNAIRVLGDIREEWSLKLLGKYLMDDRPVTAPPGTPDEDVNYLLRTDGYSTNPGLAACILKRIGLKDAPVKQEWSWGANPEEVDKWKTWWREHEGDLASALEDGKTESSDRIPGGEGARGGRGPVLKSDADSEDGDSRVFGFDWWWVVVVFLLVIFGVYFKVRRQEVSRG
ncbi:MAG: hypothetical protein Q7R22_015060 [Verrucomicrobiota bacterium JB025]|nr:hypothetical protein [Verrucomicrobiota bacterium JB025]